MAQVAITALSLENLASTHWTARAAFVLSVASGALSVFFACLLQQRISSLFGLSDLKDWLSKPASSAELRNTNRLVSKYTKARSKRHAKDEPKSELENETWLEIGKRLRQLVNEKRWVRASFNAALMIRIPSLLLNWSVGAFLVGLGIYLGSSWTQRLDASQHQSSSLGVLITYIVVTGIGLLLFFVPMLLKYLEGAPIRRLVGRVMVRANPKDDPSELSAYDILAQFNAEPEYLWRKQQKSGRRREVDEFYQIPANESRVGLGEGSVTSNTKSKLQGKEIREEHERVIEPEADRRLSQDSLYAGPVASAEHTTGLATMRQSTESVHAQANPLIAALEASILAQEQSVASFKSLLLEHQKGLERNGKEPS